MHKAVLLNEVIALLNLKQGDIVLDCTIGSGGHASRILQSIGDGGILVGLDQDEDAIERAESRLSDYKKNLVLVKTNFINPSKTTVVCCIHWNRL